MAFNHMRVTGQVSRTSESRGLSRSVPKMQNVNSAVSILNRVVDQDRTMHEFAYVGSLADDSAHPWKAREKFQMIKQVSEARCRLGIVLGDVADDLGQVA